MIPIIFMKENNMKKFEINSNGFMIEILKSDNKDFYTTSVNVAKNLKTKNGTEFQHKHLLAKIRNLLIDLPKDFNEPNFRLVNYVDEKGETRPCYNLTKDGLVYIIMKINNPTANLLSIEYIKCFNNLVETVINQQNKINQLKIELLETKNNQLTSDNNQLTLNNNQLTKDIKLLTYIDYKPVKRKMIYNIINLKHSNTINEGNYVPIEFLYTQAYSALKYRVGYDIPTNSYELGKQDFKYYNEEFNGYLHYPTVIDCLDKQFNLIDTLFQVVYNLYPKEFSAVSKDYDLS